MAGGYSSRSAAAVATRQSAVSSKILLVLTALPLSLALFAFVLQRRGAGGGGGSVDPAGIGQLAAGGNSRLPGVVLQLDLRSSRTGAGGAGGAITNSDCANQLLQRGGRMHQPGWKYDILNAATPKISITTSTSAGLEQILPWLYYHRVIGVTNFFLFVESKAASPHSTAVLEAIPGVTVIHPTKELEDKQAKSRIWNETWLAGFFFKPCNYELFVKQSLNMEMAIVFAREAGMDWIIHLDTDELLHPAGAAEYSLRRLLQDVAADVDMAVFPNYESAIEHDDIKDPFSEVSMFKKNYDHVMKETYFELYQEATRGNPNYFLTYGNGKAASRVQDNMRPNGAHRWHNYMKSPNEIKFEEAAVLHYTYTKFSDLSSRRDRCGCKPTKEDVKRCFMLEFDRAAFIIASTASQEEMKRWYKEHVVWTDKELNLKLMRNGLLTRIYAPQVIVQGLREAGVFSDALLAGQARVEKSHSQTLVLPSVSQLNTIPATNTGNSTIMNNKKVKGASKDIYTVRGIIGQPKDVVNEQAADRRKLLKFSSNGIVAAIAPLSPPDMDQLVSISLRT